MELPTNGGDISSADSYHDQWMSEGFAEFSASLYVQSVPGSKKFLTLGNTELITPGERDA
jgi:hypothetical protein